MDYIPTKKEQKKALNVANELIKKIKKYVGKNVNVVLAGSLAKGTNIKGNYDIDIFILLPPTIKKENFENYVKKIAKKFGKFEIGYAEHPYVRFYYKKYKVELVPSYNIKYINEIKTSVDRTQLHTEYINKKLNKKEKNEVRKLKFILKKFGIYGAEIKTQGFSGYLCELLIAKYKTVKNLMEDAKKWKNVFIDIEGKKEKEFDGLFVVIDPVDGKRNVASAVSKENFYIFIKIARKYPKLNIKINKRDVENTFVVEFNTKKMNEEKKWGRIRRMFKLVFKEFSKYVPIIGYEINDKISFKIIDNEKNYILKKGPLFLDYKNVEKFEKKHKNVYLIDDRIYSLEKRKIKKGEDILKIIKKFNKEFKIIKKMKIKKGNKKDVERLIRKIKL